MKGNPSAITFVHDGREQIYAFVRGDDGQLHDCFWDATPGVSSWRWDHRNQPTSARVNSSPTALTSIQNQNAPEHFLHVFTRGNDGHLYEHYWNGSQWVGWVDHNEPHSPTTVTMGPAAVTFRGRYGEDDPLFDIADRIFVFVWGSDGNLYRFLHRDRLWHFHGLHPHMTELACEPAVINHNLYVYAYVVGNDSRLYVNYTGDRAGRFWHWHDLGRPDTTPLVWFNRPSLVSYTHDREHRIYAFVRGGDGHLWNHFWQGSQQQGQGTWGDLGAPAGTRMASEPEAVTFTYEGTSRIYVFFRGNDDHLHIRFWDGARWNWADMGRPTTGGHDVPAQPGGGNTPVSSAPGVVTFRYTEPNRTTDRIYAFVRGGDNHLHQCYWNGVDLWLWNDLGLAETTSNLQITGVEHTQAIQFFRPPISITDPCTAFRSGVQPENDISLVAGKAVVLRVYVNVNTLPGLPTVTGVSGTLEIRQIGSSAWTSLIPCNSNPIGPRRANQIDRGNPNHTLNFCIPASLCQGNLETRLTAFDASHPGETTFTSDSVSKTLAFANNTPMRIRLVRIRYQNAARGINVAAPTLDDFWTTASFTLKTYPIPRIILVAESEELYDGDFSGLFDAPPGAIGTTGSIFTIIDRLMIAENNLNNPTIKYFALIPGSPANQSGALGWGVAPNRAVGEVFQGPVMAQELAHACFRAHAPCGNPGGVDQCYPTYANHPSGSIGEFGFDTVNLTTHNPAQTFDFMSYCLNQAWISPYTYEALMGCFPAPFSASERSTETEDTRILREMLNLFITINREGKVVEREPGFHLPGLSPSNFGRPTPYFVELHDGQDRTIESQRLYLADIHKSLDDAYIDFLVTLPWHAEANKIVFKRENKIIHEIKIGKSAPKVSMVSPGGGDKLEGNQKIQWISNRFPKPLSYILRYSNNGGLSWLAVASRITSENFTVDFDHLPGGEKCIFQVLASEGVRTVTATSEVLVVPRKPRVVSIISPHEGDIFQEGNPVHLLGMALSPEERSAKPEDLRWSSSIEGFLGTGVQLMTQTLSAGKHNLTLRTRDILGGEVSKTISITVQPRDRGSSSAVW